MLYVIPLEVKALYAPQATQVLGQDMVFENIPWFNSDKQVFVKALVPLTSNSIIPSPFSNEHLINLEKGLHLHWHMPKPFKLFNNTGNLPRVPTRWFIKKKNGHHVIGEWIVESDYLWDINDPNLKAYKHATYPIPKTTDLKDGFDFKYIGRTLPLSEWIDEMEQRDPDRYLGEMTSLGWGTLNFDMHYANCRSIFGFHDEEYLPEEDSSYQIIGFYTDDEQDFMRHLITSNREELLRRISSLNLEQLEYEEAIRQGVINPSSTNSQQNLPSEDVSQVFMKAISPNISFNTDKIARYADRLMQPTHVYTTMSLSDRIQRLENIGNNLSLDHITNEINNSLIYDVEHAYQFFLDHNRFQAVEYEAFLTSTHQDKLLDSTIRHTNLKGRSLSPHTSIHTIVAVNLTINTEELPTEINTSPLSPLPIKISIANTLPEALTAILTRNEENTVHQLIKEEQIESLLNLGELEDKNLDWISRLRTLRHTQQFKRSEAVRYWSLQTDTGNPYNPNQELLIFLVNLNNSQKQYDLRKFELYKAIENIYLDWNYYVEHLFRGHLSQVQIESNRIYSVLTRKSIPKIDILKQKLAGLQEDINQIKQNIKQLIASENIKLELKTSTAYYESLPPSVILYQDAQNPLPSELQDIFTNSENTDVQDICCVHNLSLVNTNEIITLIRQIQEISIENILPYKTHSPSWYSYKIEWEANFLNHRDKKRDGDYNEEYLRNNYIVEEQNADLVKHPLHYQHTYAADYNIYFGHSHIHTGIAKLFKDKLNGLLQNEQSSVEKIVLNDGNEQSIEQLVTTLNDEIDQLSLLEISLSDFNNIFMQRNAALSMMPLIPNGYLPHQDLALKITNLFKEFEHEVDLLNPNPFAQFSPFKDGAFRISKLRVVDTFGRYKLVQVEESHTTFHQKIHHKANWIGLPPRIAQPATIYAEWLDAQNLDSPVFGWLMLNLIDIRIECYDANGKHIGSFVANGNWEFSPFDKHLASQDFDEQFGFLSYNKDLQQVLKWFHQQMNSSDRIAFFTTLFEQINLSLSYIEPENSQNPTLMESITTTPLALSKVSINLFVKGGLNHDLNKEDFKAFIEGNQTRNFKKYNQVKVPIHIGDYTQYHNACVGYWHAEDLQQEQITNTHLYFNNPEFVSLKIEKLSDSHPKYAELVRLDNLYRIDKTLNLSLFLQNIRIPERSNKINKTDFISAYIIEGDNIWNLLKEMQVLVTTSLTQTLSSYSTNNYNNQEINGLKIKQIDEKSYLTIDSESRERTLFMMMHPKGTLHIKSGVLPQQQLELPYEKIKEALKRLELTIYAGPIVTPKDHLEISLTKDNNYYWSWLNLQKPPLPFRNRTTQLRSIDLKKVDLPMTYNSLQAIIQMAMNEGMLLNIQPSKSYGEQVFILNPNFNISSNQPSVEDKVLFHLLKSTSFDVNLSNYQDHFFHSTRIYQFENTYDWSAYQRLLNSGLISYFPLFLNKKYVLLSERGLQAMLDSQVRDSLLPIQRQDLALLVNSMGNYVPLTTCQLVELDTELLQKLNLQHSKHKFLTTSLLKNDDFYYAEDIYFIQEDVFNQFEKIYLDILTYQELKEDWNQIAMSAGATSVDNIWNSLKKISYLTPLIHQNLSNNIKTQVIQRIMTNPLYMDISTIIQELSIIENLLLNQAEDSEFVGIQAQISKLIESQDSSYTFNERWQFYIDLYNLIKNNNQSINTIHDFNYSNTLPPTIILKEGWLSLKSTLY